MQEPMGAAPKPFPAKAFAIPGIVGSLCAAPVLLFLSDWLSPGLYRFVPQFFKNAAIAGSIEMIIVVAGGCVLLCALPFVGLFIVRRSLFQTFSGMIGAVATVLLGFTLLIVAGLFRDVFILMKNLQAGRLICGAFVGALACAACAGGLSLSIAYAIKARGAALALFIIAAVFFTPALCMQVYAFADSVFAVLRVPVGFFYRPLTYLWMMPFPLLSLSLATMLWKA